MVSGSKVLQVKEESRWGVMQCSRKGIFMQSVT